VPSPAAIGIGMLITAAVLLTFILGGVAQLIWAKVSPSTEKTYRIPLASGLICGEAIIAVVLAVLAAMGVNFDLQPRAILDPARYRSRFCKICVYLWLWTGATISSTTHHRFTNS